MQITKIQFFVSLSLASFFGGMMALSAYFLYVRPQEGKQNKNILPTSAQGKMLQSTEFKHITQKVRPAVVHIKLIKPRSNYLPVETDEEETEKGFFGSGSGVIITEDGYIVTNNHVVENAQGLEVILPDKRSFKAQIIGTDIATDLALLKIEGKNLPTAQLAAHDETLEIGDWVLAIGNPFDLTSSVTAGIVSGKGRNINLLRHDVANQKNAVESFIQTDAAINPGNSGGALINMQGEVVGINTAIATHTGSYTGFSFAIPVSLVHKVVSDLKQHGETKRAIMGVKLLEIDSKLMERKNLKDAKGVFVQSVAENSSASFAGIKEGDVITFLGKKEVNSIPDFNAQIALYTPNQKIKVTYIRNSVSKTIEVVLRSTVGKVADANKEKNVEMDNQIFGAELSLPTPTEKKKLGIKTGVKIQQIQAGKLQSAGIKAGFIITYIDGKQVQKIEDVKKILIASKQKSKAITIEGYYWGAGKAYYAIGW